MYQMTPGEKGNKRTRGMAAKNPVSSFMTLFLFLCVSFAASEVNKSNPKQVEQSSNISVP